MEFFVTILHVVLSISMILIILLQPGKEGGAALTGGGSNQMYGPRGAANLLGRATTVVAAMFMCTSITLAWYSSVQTRAGTDIQDDIQRLEDESDERGFDIPEKSGLRTGPITPPVTPEVPAKPSEPSNEDETAPAPTP